MEEEGEEGRDGRGLTHPVIVRTKDAMAEAASDCALVCDALPTFMDG